MKYHTIHACTKNMICRKMWQNGKTQQEHLNWLYAVIPYIILYKTHFTVIDISLLIKYNIGLLLRLVFTHTINCMQSVSLIALDAI